MPRSLAWKLTLAFLLVALTVALLVGVFIRLSSPDQLNRLIVDQQRSELHDLLVSYYAAHGSWQGVGNYVAQAHGGPPPPPNGQPGPGEPPHPDYQRDRHQLFALADAQGVIVMPLLPDYPAGRRVTPADLAQGAPVEVNGAAAGTILTTRMTPGLNPEESAYLQRIYLALVLAGGGAVLVALLVGGLLARTLTRPLHALTQATHRMAGGELEQEVLVNSRDEIGELATAFNRMSREVARANNARRRMTADIAHELRTPLTVIAGYIESMRDGVLASTPERLSVIYEEIEHLQHLVGDLRTLSQADAGELKLNRQRLAAPELLGQSIAAFEHQAEQKGVRLELEPASSAASGASDIYGDETRLAQVLGNLISNALRYTPAGGRVTLGAGRAGDQATLTVRDTGQGIPPEDLPFVFNRLYRADKSRADENGETGLGLAIVKALVEAHGGTIETQSALGSGTTFVIRLPAGDSQSV